MPRYGFPIVPSGISAAIGALDGVVASTDANAGRTRFLGGPPTASGASAPGTPRALIVQGGAVATGFLGWFLNWPTDFVDPFIGMGLGLFARELGFRMAQSGRSAPQAAQAWRAVANAPGAAALAAPAPSPAAWRKREPAGRLGG